MNKIFSITITFNPDVNILLSQIKKLVDQVEKVIIIDNASSNIVDIQKALNEFDIELISLRENVGIAKAQNIGIELARNQKASHVILFDHDSELSKNFICNLVGVESELLSRGLKVGAVGPVYYDAETGEICPVAHFKSLSKYSGFKLNRIYLDEINHTAEVYLLIASGCLIRMSVLESIGYMDEGLFIDNVDLEWCYRARSESYKLYATSKAKLKHRIGDGSRSFLGRKVAIHSNLRKYYNARNNLYLLINSNVPLGAKIRCIFSFVSNFIIGLIDSSNRKEYVKYYLYALIDFSKRKNGKFIRHQI